VIPVPPAAAAAAAELFTGCCDPYLRTWVCPSFTTYYNVFRRTPTHSCGPTWHSWYRYGYIPGPNLFTPLLDNSRLILSFNNRIPRRCRSRGEDGYWVVHFWCTRFPVSYHCGDSSAESFTAFFFLIRSTQSTDFGAFHWSPCSLHFQLECFVTCRRYGRFPFISIGSCCADSTDATFTSSLDIRLPVLRLGFSWSFS
jgi:hypothetical protein